MSEPQFTEQDWRRLLASFGEDPDRAGLVETPSRVAKAWKHWTAGYAQDPAECLKVFEDGAQERGGPNRLNTEIGFISGALPISHR